MTDKPSFDPMAYFREMVSEWERISNDIGSKITSSSEFTQVMHQAGSAQMQARKAMQDMMSKSLAAANMPSRLEIEALSERLGAIEAHLVRIEALLTGSRVPGPEAPPAPKRTRKPPTAA